jgi:hypothetical protein
MAALEMISSCSTGKPCRGVALGDALNVPGAKGGGGWEAFAGQWSKLGRHKTTNSSIIKANLPEVQREISIADFLCLYPDDRG